MTSRTSPVGLFLFAAAGVFLVGCSTTTSAVFEALLEPATAPSSPPGDIDEPVAEDLGPRWWLHPEGYGLSLPAGWSGAALNGAQADQLMAALETDHPGLAARAATVLDETGSDVSMVAADGASTESAWSAVLVLAQPTAGRKKRVVRAQTYDWISALDGLRGSIIRDDVRLPNHPDTVRYDFAITDDDLGPLRVRAYLIPFGGTAYLVNFVANGPAFDASALVFDAIIESIRFGV